ncbi:hypothetical protein ACJ73_08188 [Blastomyces percursus]|uniref:CCHC-type domain-containing protein n=1 Tax=Blastomyces percursus TaxID=1658174 RepID=A0A1J9QXB3_9EURO|nr:hypothetical protein ACJ73_08188 [Blastomyces percursus]
MAMMIWGCYEEQMKQAWGQRGREFEVEADDQKAVIEFLGQKVERQGMEHKQVAGDLAFYLAWKSKASAKLGIDGRAISSPSDQAWYIHSRLDGDVLAKFQPWMSHCSDDQRTPELVFQQLDTIFLDPTLQAQALDWLNETRQRNTALASYLPEFDRKLLEAGEVGRSGTRPSRSTCCSGTRTSSCATEAEYCADLRLLNNDLSQFRAIQNREGFRRTDAYTSSSPVASSEPEPMDWAPHINAGRPKVPNVSGKDAADRIARGVCIRCNQAGHFVRECPNAIAPSRSTTRVSTTTPSPVDKKE